MQAITALIVSLFDLVEHEARILRAATIATARAVVGALFAAVAALLGLAMVLYGIYLEVSERMSPSVGAFIAGIAAFAVAAAVIQITKPKRRP
jgi:hypothetical protein